MNFVGDTKVTKAKAGPFKATEKVSPVQRASSRETPVLTIFKTFCIKSTLFREASFPASPPATVAVAWSTAWTWNRCLPLAVQDYTLVLAKPILQASLPQSCILTSVQPRPCYLCIMPGLKPGTQKCFLGFFVPLCRSWCAVCWGGTCF